ncbi:MAG: hypothetical protein H0V64_01850 [Geodermatophilaceae bacterium]|nr:hypothetical protein [Geodermatophilaceae bacterium]MDQ3465488.1 hypothetical protein [Actinomycetota bacterium]
MTSWTWRYEDEHGAEVDGPAAQHFDNRSDAESWLGESWRELSDAGVHQVSLLHDGGVVYGPMGLDPV